MTFGEKLDDEEKQRWIISEKTVADAFHKKSETWPLILDFANRAEAQLEKHRAKGSPKDWLQCSAEQIIEAILDETVVIQMFHTLGDAEEMIRKCANLANYAMMTAFWYQEFSKNETSEEKKS